MPNFFELLNIDPTDDLKMINRAYRQYVLSGHPDKGGDSAIFLFISDERKKLQDDHYRRQVFRQLCQPEPMSQASVQAQMEFALKTLREMRESLQEMKESLREMQEALKELYTNDIPKTGSEGSEFFNLPKAPDPRVGFFTSGTLATALLTSGFPIPDTENNTINDSYEIDSSLLFLMIALSSIIASALLYIIFRSCQSPRCEADIQKP